MAVKTAKETRQVERIDIAEAHKRLRAQGVSGPDHYAFVCPICGTVQSMASIIAAGCAKGQALVMVAVTCEGRFASAGPEGKDRSRMVDRSQQPSCGRALGGYVKFHTLEIEFDDGTICPSFQIASPEQAQTLARALASRAAPASRTPERVPA